jgi:hypothetical protein
MKVSAHKSGQVHLRLTRRDLHQLSPLLLLSGETWYHALEVRFLLSDGAFTPQPGPLADANALLIDLPREAEAVLVLNLIIEPYPGSGSLGLPNELNGARQIWGSSLRDGCEVSLVARLMPFDKKNRDELHHIRFELTPKATFPDPLTVPPFIEVMNVSSTPHGSNVILVVPMGAEAVRVAPAANAAAASAGNTRPIRLVRSASPIDLLAPDGSIVATLSVNDVDDVFMVPKGVATKVPTGTVKLTLDCSKLRFGEIFERPTARWPVKLLVDAASPREWRHDVSCRFDGMAMHVKIRELSVGMRNANLSAPMPQLLSTEEMVIVEPANNLVLTASAESPIVTAPIIAAIEIRDF